MKLTLVVAVVLFAACANATPSQNKKTLGTAKCNGRNIKLSRQLNAARQQCLGYYFSTDVVKNTKMPFMKRMTCANLCELQGYGLISSDYKISESNVSTFVDNVFPKEDSAELKAAVMICANEKGQNLEVTDESCESFLPFIECMKTSVASICNV